MENPLLRPCQRTQDAKSSDPNGSASRLRQAREAVAICPRDITARCELAALLESGGEIQGALNTWMVALSLDPNTLNAWVGVARCRRRLAAASGQEP